MAGAAQGLEAHGRACLEGETGMTTHSITTPDCLLSRLNLPLTVLFSFILSRQPGTHYGPP
jgi:hypothetical protein